MNHVSSFNKRLLNYIQCGTFLLALSGLEPAARGQSFGPKTDYPSWQPSDIVLGDVNGDGYLDIVTVNGGIFSGAASVLLKLAGGGFAPYSNYYTGGGPSGVALGDVNGDGRLDIVTANSVSNTASVLPGLTGGAFGFRTDYRTSNGASDVALDDVNGDGRLDIITSNSDFSTASVLLGIVGGGFAAKVDYPTGGYPQRMTLGDINNDGHLDIITANKYANTVSVLPGIAGGDFGPKSDYSTGASPNDVALGDVNSDGRLDIVTVNSSGSGSTASVLLGLAGGGFGVKSDYFTGAGPYGVALGDVSGDGRLDIVIANYGASTVSVLPGLAEGIFGPKSDYSTGRSPISVALSDINGDDRLDIVTANQGDNSISILLNIGNIMPLATTRPASSDVILFPNPAHDAFTVQLPASFGLASAQAELLNALGQVVCRPMATKASFQVETSGLAPGVYTLRLHTGAAALAKRVVVE